MKPIEVTPVNPLISHCKIKVCYVGENRNGSSITKEVATNIGKTLPGSPIVGFYNEETGDFEGHNEELVVREDKIYFKSLTRPYGFVDLNADVWFENSMDGDEEHEYLMTEGYLWTGQYPEARLVLEHGKGQSMELDEESVKGDWSKDTNSNREFFIINEAIISKLCILGDDVEPCFEGASISKFSFDEGFKAQLFSFMEQMKEVLEKGETYMENEKDTLLEEEVLPEVNEEEVAAPEVSVTYNLDEIPEYTELVSKYTALENDNASLQANIASLEEELGSLRAFKYNVEKKDKETMIASFYMLSDEDKADVIANIDNYSLDEIEAKLSVICVRNKVNFSLDNNTPENTTFNVTDDMDDGSVPAWIKAVQSVAKKNK